MALQGWDKNLREQLKIQQLENEALQQQLMIAGKGGSPGQPYDDPEKGKGPFVPAPPRDKLMIAHGEYFDEYGQPIQDPTRGMDPSGNPITIPHLQQTPEEAEQNRQLHMMKYHQAGATSRQIRDRLKGFTRGGPYDDSGGSLRGVPDALRIQLLRDAMA